MDVAEQVGNVLFTLNAAFVLDSGFGAGGAASMTKIADATTSMLYSFDVVTRQFLFGALDIETQSEWDHLRKIIAFAR